MPSFTYPGFQSITEFSRAPDGDQRFGDCGWAALLPLLHLVNPTRWPLTPTALDLLVEDAGRRGLLMASNGMVNIPNLDTYLTQIGIPHVTVGYNDFTFDKLHAALRALGNTPPGPPSLVEWSTAGKGLLDDEANVGFHFSAFAGMNDVAGPAGGYYRADGDSRTDNQSGVPTPPILTGITSIEAANPIGFITILIGVSAMGLPTNWHDDGTTLTAPNGQKTAGWIRGHILEAVPQWPSDLMPIAPLYGIAGGWQQDFQASRSVIATTAGTTSEKAGLDFHAELVAANTQLSTAASEIASLKQQLATLQSQAGNTSVQQEIGQEVQQIETLLTTHS